MKKFSRFLLHELKKNLWALVVLTAVCAIPYVTTIASMQTVVRFRIEENVWNYYTADPNLWVVFLELGILCFFVPALTFSFKMNKRSVDAYYALPLKKEKLYLVKTLVGLLLVLVPFTVAYWGGFFTMLCRPDRPYVMRAYIPAYFGGVLFGVCLYGVNAFLFTRANKVFDGIVFMAAYAFIGYILAVFFEELTGVFISWRITEGLLTFGSLIIFPDAMGNAIRGTQYSHMLNAFVFVYPIVLALISYFLLFFNLRYEKAENAEQVSHSWFGYKILIPLYIVLLVAICEFEPLGLCGIAVGGVVASIVYQGKFRFSWKWWLVLVGAFALGCAFGGLIEILYDFRLSPVPENY